VTQIILTATDCNRDESYNILVDPAGNQELCTNTELTPDDVPRLSTCPIRKNQLVSGNWSIIIISNNGDGYPLAAQRDFVLSVGPQSTSTVSSQLCLNQLMFIEVLVHPDSVSYIDY